MDPKWKLFASFTWWKQLSWRYWLKTSIRVKWPTGWANIDGVPNLSVESSDPNDWYRWWLEKHVGRQNWAWDWNVVVNYTNEMSVHEWFFKDELEIRFRNPAHATMFALRWTQNV